MTTQFAVEPPPSMEDGGHKMFAWLRQMRDHYPVWQDEYGTWHVFRHADVQRVITDYEEFSADQSRAVPDTERVSRGDLTLLDPPEHRKLRNVVASVFTRRAIEKLAGRITEICENLLAEVDGRDEFDLVHDFAYPLPVTVIAELLGVPAEDQPLFRKWAEMIRFADGTDPNNPELIKAVEESVSSTVEYLNRHCRDRRANPRDDLISRLVAAEVDGYRLDDDEVSTFAGLLLMTGHVTTVVLLANSFLCFADTPGVYARLRAERERVPATVEEVLRYRAPFMHTKRVAKHEVDIAGVKVPPNQMIEAWLLSANHDERQIPDADQFRIDRESSSHLGLGHGIHFCLGAPLARLEGKIALNLLLDRFTDVEILTDRVQPYGWGLSGAQSLPVRVRRA